MAGTRALTRRRILLVALITLMTGVSIWVGMIFIAGRAEAAIARSDWADAERWSRRYLAVHPGHPQMNLALAQALVSTGRCPEARRQLARIPNTDPLGPTARLREAEVLLMCEGFAAHAEQMLRKVMALDPKSADARRLLLYLYRLEDRQHDAREIVWDAHKYTEPAERHRVLTTWFLLEYAQMKANEILPWLHRFRTNDADDVNAHVAIASLRHVQADVKSALETLLAHPPPAGHSAGQALLAQCYLDMGEPEKARSILDRWPDQEDIRYWRLRGIDAQVYRQSPEQAIGWFRRVLKAHPDEWTTRHRLAQCLRAAGMSKEADLEQAETQRIQKIVTHEFVKELIDRIVPQLDASPDARHSMGSFYEQLRRPHEAQLWYEESLRLDPGHKASLDALKRMRAG